MDYITVKEAAKNWNVSTRRVQILCSQDRIKGAYRFGKSWMIPNTAVLPNARKKVEEPHLPMPRKSPFLDMTNLYNKAGGAIAGIAAGSASAAGVGGFAIFWFVIKKKKWRDLFHR